MPDDEEICEDCEKAGELCPYHLGFEAGWDAAAVAMERQRI